MPPIAWIEPDQPLPDPANAPADGLLAAGFDLNVARLKEAYSKGIFPWFSEGDPVLWWCPDPRMVLIGKNLKISRSLGKKLRQLERTERQLDAPLRITVNTAFSNVIQACSEPRNNQPATWISPWVKSTYYQWHRAGHAHSIETWQHGELAGGLYGVNLGGCFFGESMFSRTSDSSKLALIYLVHFLSRNGVNLIDCQQETPHLASLGAKPVSRAWFLTQLDAALMQTSPVWQKGQLLQGGEFALNTLNPP